MRAGETSGRFDRSTKRQLPPRTHIWMGCLVVDSGSQSSCSAGPPIGRPAAVVCSDQPGDCVILCGTSDVPDGRWHHLAARKIGHPDAAVTLWFDGTIEGSGTTTLVDQLEFADGTDLGIGHFAAPPARDADTQGALDEVAIFRRGLTDAEMRDLFLRGATRLRFRVRVCAEPDCSDAPAFIGPDGTEDSAYEDATDAPAGHRSIPPACPRGATSSIGPGSRPRPARRAPSSCGSRSTPSDEGAPACSARRAGARQAGPAQGRAAQAVCPSRRGVAPAQSGDLVAPVDDAVEVPRQGPRSARPPPSGHQRASARDDAGHAVVATDGARPGDAAPLRHRYAPAGRGRRMAGAVPALLGPSPGGAGDGDRAREASAPNADEAQAEKGLTCHRIRD
jgi:hypothetical protein